MKGVHKGLAMVVLSAIVALMMGIGGITANAAVVESEADKLFYETLSNIFDYEKADTTEVSADKERLYDIDLNELGIAYSFTYGEEQGFAILIDDGELRVTEFYSQGESPYQQAEGKYVYVKQGIYWYSDGESFYDCETELPVSEDSVSLLGEEAYRGGTDPVYETERVDYLYRSENKYNILPSIPTCMFGEAGSCVAKMCTNLVVYIDKTYTNLIPNYEPGIAFMGSYMYQSDTTETMAVYDQLYDDTGTDANGATVADFKSGFQTYVNRQGYSVNYTSLYVFGAARLRRRVRAMDETGRGDLLDRIHADDAVVFGIDDFPGKYAAGAWDHACGKRGAADRAAVRARQFGARQYDECGACDDNGDQSDKIGILNKNTKFVTRELMKDFRLLRREQKRRQNEERKKRMKETLIYVLPADLLHR